MENEFVSYEMALALKELRFDEPCFAWYKNGKLRIELYWNLSELGNQDCVAPTFSQAFRFFRDEKLSDSCVCRYQSRDDGGIYYYYVINHDFVIEETKHFKEGFFSYEEAELACLLKMIEIVKKKSV